MPAISAIPSASALQMQLASVNSAIAALDTDGTVIPNMVVQPGANPGDPNAFVMAIGLTLDPPISNPTTLQQVKAALQAQATEITQELVSMGFTDDSGAILAQGPAPVSRTAAQVTQEDAPREQVEAS